MREKSGLLIETPSQSLDLADYPEQNRQDIQAYIQNYLTLQEIPPTPLLKGGNIPLLLTGVKGDLKSWLSNHQISEQEFCDRLTTLSENNFMYLSQVINAVAENFYPESFEYNQLPPGLETFYQQHLHKMIPPKQGTEHSTDVLNVLIQQQKSISVEALAQSAASIARIIDTDEYEVEEVLENWLEFLQQQRIASETHYSLYHSNFRDWLCRQAFKIL